MGRATRIPEITSLEEYQFNRLFLEFDRMAYRLETLQEYSVPYEEESLRRFLIGGPRPNSPINPEWVRLVHSASAAGKRMQRVHIVVEPLSDYVRFELLWGYDSNVAAGEDIWIIPTQSGQWPNELPKKDYWLFDYSKVVVMKYNRKGAFKAAKFETRPSKIDKYNEWRDTALSRAKAIPYAEYISKLDDPRVKHV